MQIDLALLYIGFFNKRTQPTGHFYQDTYQDTLTGAVAPGMFLPVHRTY